MRERKNLIYIMTLVVALFAVSPATAQTTRKRTQTKPAKTSPKSTTSRRVETEVSSSVRVGRKVMGEEEREKYAKPRKGEVRSDHKFVAGSQTEIEFSKPAESKLERAGSFNGDLRRLPKSKIIRFDRTEREPPNEDEVIEGDPVELGAGQSLAPVAAPAPLTSFDGLDFANWGAGRPPDTNGDVGPTYFIQSVNSSIGIYRKSDGVRVAAFTLNNFMSQGAFGNLCDTNNFGDPVVLYDTFEDRWIITDFAFTIDGAGNVTSNSFQCFAASKTGDPVTGGWNFYSTVETDFLGDYPKFAVWPDGIYWSANMFGKTAGGSFAGVRVRSMNKAQMYAGAPSVQAVTFDAPAGEFTILPSNARLQTGTPPVGTPNLMSVVWQFTNAISVYKFKVDWNKVSTSTLTGPFTSIAPASWASAPNSVSTPSGSAATNNDTLAVRLMVQNQYTNIGGVESLWNSHTVRGSSTTQSAVRYYQVNVTGGTVAAATTQANTYNPDTNSRYMPSIGINRSGDMALVYTVSSGTVNPAIRYAGNLATDPLNVITQTETSLIEGGGYQNTSTRWGDYSTMTLDPDGCTYWMTSEYFGAISNNWLTRIGAFAYPGCVALANNGSLTGTITSSTTGLPVSGATVRLGSRSATTNAAGVYTFSNLPSGTYQLETATAGGYTDASATNLTVSDGVATTRDLALGTPASSACLTDTAQGDFENGILSQTDAVTASGDVVLSKNNGVNQSNTALGTSGVGVTITTWAGQTFTPTVTGPLTKMDINFFCSGCTGTTPALTASIRATSGGLPTGADLATATVAGFASGASAYYTATFATPTTVTAGTMYAVVVRPTANPSAGTYALTRSGTTTVGSSTYAGGTRISGATSGTVWSIPTTGGVTTDAGFKAYIDAGYQSAGNFVSGVKDSNPAAANSTIWQSVSWTGSTPANTTLGIQVAASNSINGPFNFVGPDNTAATFFTSGASLAQFNGFRYLKYKAALSTTDTLASPSLSDITICYTVPRVWTGAVSSDWNNASNWVAGGVPGSTDRAIVPATGVTNSPVNTTPASVGSLRLDSGIIDTGGNTLTVTSCSPTAVIGGSPTSYVKGTLIRCVDGSGSYAFPVGTTSGFSPVAFSNVVGTGTFSVTPVEAALPGVDTLKSLSRYWTLSPTGITQADVTLNYLDSDVPVGADESTFKFLRRSGGLNTDFAPTSSNPAANTFTLAGVASFSDWSVGKLLVPTAAGVAVGGRVTTADGRGIANATVVLRSAQTGATRTARTNSFGVYRFDDVAAGAEYVLTANAKGRTFGSRVVSVSDNIADADIVAN